MAADNIPVSLENIEGDLRRILHIQFKEFLRYLEEVRRENLSNYRFRYIRITVDESLDGQAA